MWKIEHCVRKSTDSPYEANSSGRSDESSNGVFVSGLIGSDWLDSDVDPSDDFPNLVKIDSIGDRLEISDELPAEEGSYLRSCVIEFL